MADVAAWVLSLDTLDDRESVADRISQEGVDGTALPLFAQSADFRLLKQVAPGNAHVDGPLGAEHRNVVSAQKGDVNRQQATIMHSSQD